ncbi:unnamed protein product [Haemonchus placei]|uniref:COMM domain-containing protein n=1 Tax=Haemonchus placei TaxID=6290 RepID=A0A0N4WCS8_HAEPC|nr:unnamed protein product [Haemonchus placei]
MLATNSSIDFRQRYQHRLHLLHSYNQSSYASWSYQFSKEILRNITSKISTLPELLDGLNEAIEEFEKSDDYTTEHQLSTCDQEMLNTVAFGVIKSTERAGNVHASLLDYHQLPLSFVLNTKDKITVSTSPLTLNALDENTLRSLDIRLETLTALRRVTPLP